MKNSETLSSFNTPPETYISNLSSADPNITTYSKLIPIYTSKEVETNQFLKDSEIPNFDDWKVNCNETKKRILIIEDSSKLRNILTQILGEHYEISGFGNADEALENFGSINPDIILLDIMLPGSIDGLSFLRIIRMNKNYLHIPVILMSLLSTDAIITEGLKLGANDFIVKPFDLRQLDLKIKNYINLNKELRDKMLLEQNINFEVKNEFQEVLQKFDMLIEKGIMNDSDIKIEKYALELNMSISTLERVIKKVYKMSPTKYIMKRKLEKADILIRTNQGLSIKEIALTLGFSSLSYFCRCYKIYYSKSASQTSKIS